MSKVKQIKKSKEKTDNWRRIKTGYNSYKLIDKNDNTVAENIMSCDLDLLQNAPKMEKLLIEVIHYENNREELDEETVERIRDVLEEIEGVSCERE